MFVHFGGDHHPVTVSIQDYPFIHKHVGLVVGRGGWQFQWSLYNFTRPCPSAFWLRCCWGPERSANDVALCRQVHQCWYHWFTCFAMFCRVSTCRESPMSLTSSWTLQGKLSHLGWIMWV
jgi:hypothetical protein